MEHAIPEDAWVSGVEVIDVRADGHRITVDIAGGAEGVVGSIRYEPGATYDDTLQTLLYWKHHGTRLTYVCRRGAASLRDEAAAFAEAWGEDAPTG